MNKSKVLIAMITLITIMFMLTACGTNDKQVDIEVNSIKADDNTVSLNEYIRYKASDTVYNNTNTDSLSQGYDEIGELILLGADNSVEYKVVDNNIQYKEKVFLNLSYDFFNSIETPYDKNTLINFIVKLYGGSSNTVEAFTEIETADLLLDEYYIPLADTFYENSTYNVIRDKYGEDINWTISLVDSETDNMLSLYGCSKYVIITNTDSDIIIDMSNYDSSIN